MPSLKPNEQAYWDAYLATLPLQTRPSCDMVLANFAGNAAITDGLLELYLSGRKSAGSSLLEDYEAAGDPLPRVGNHWIYLDSKGDPRCILRTEKVVFNKFKDIPAEIAVAEGEGDLSIVYWKRVHAELYEPYLQAWGIGDLAEATVLTEYFKIVFK